MEFVKPYKWQIVGTVLIGVVKFSIPLLIPLLLKYVLDDVIDSDTLSDSEKIKQLLMIMGGSFFVFLILRPPVEYYRQYYAQWVSSKVLYDIRNQLFDHIQKLSLRYYSNTRVGEIISRVINDVEQTKNFVITGLMNVWLDMFTIVIAIIIMFTMNVPLTLVSIILLPLYALSVRYFYGRLRHLTRVRSQALAEVQGHLHERVQGISVIRSFAIENHEQAQFDDQNRNFLQKAIDHTNWNAKTFAVVNTITDLAPLIVIAFAGYQVINENLSIGTMVAFVGYIDRLYNPLRRLVNSSTTLTQSVASMDRMFEFIDEQYDIVDSPNAKDALEIKGAVQFNNVSFAYEEDEYILHDINLDVEQGKSVAFVGMSGGGKSTIISLIPRFYDVSSGEILIDGVNVKDYQTKNLRDQIGIVLQDTVLFSDTIRNNILLGKPGATDEDVVAAAKAANAHDFIMKLPNGYDTKVGERGMKLSGGQKQRVSIARVFLKNPPILIFDEATSALDLESEHYIQETLEKLAKERTTFIVAHRLSTITHVDEIVLVQDGKVVEQGSHGELMKKKGYYYDLFTVQQLGQN
ncbi:ABC transporter ATP-binding protein/permease [Priestia flexa]|jgi:ATP-binding cassette, subfamily B, putative efflux pump|uniref:Multidrug ABC transporter ATP-binding protein n=3 Tax=Bacillales TaxID=1385 RepID=A0A0V8JML8_9BACI|nr:ABC transporter ATP-binding protein [Priestia flexa]KSU88293.1 multidrug ABC transporter ATP-binding protein [Priestia veravalensis]MBN8252914.1 ABC transporter ATP-binding protein [Priestia flexa]UIR32125.1 ABC transporter ATP-binding protein/permease [Priestia flexa]UZW67904.1 ABC transporter ATP-binding protein/permease [Priestia flexa]SCC15981.1 ATP-binding cassette, subfamily B, MsbA [Priestia flexa]